MLFTFPERKKLRMPSNILLPEHNSPFSYELQHDHTNRMTCATREDLDQPGHPPSLIRVLAVRSVNITGPKVSSCGQMPRLI